MRTAPAGSGAGVGAALRNRPGPLVALVAAVAGLVLLRPTFGVVIYGAVIGALYGLIALGLVLVFRATRVLNLAQASLGAVPASAALLLNSEGLPYPVAIALALVMSVALGALVSIVLRRFRNSSRLVVTVATLGIAQLLAALEIQLPGWIVGKAIPSIVTTPFSSAYVTTGGVHLSGDHLVAIGVVTGVVVGLSLFLARSRVGIAVRATVGNPDRAALLGIPVPRIVTLVWVIAAILSTLGVLLRAPLVGLPSGGSASANLLLYALAAATIGRFESLPVTFAAGVGLGILDQSSFFHSRRPDLSIALVLPLVLGALLLQRRDTSRAADPGDAIALPQPRRIPSALAGLVEVRVGRAAAVLLGCGLLVALPGLVGAGKLQALGSLPIYALLCLSLVVLTGWAGQVSLGQLGFSAAGALVAGQLGAEAGADFFLTLLVSAAAGALVALVVGIPALRVPGVSLGVVTLAVAGTMWGLAVNPQYAKALLPGSDLPRPDLYQHYSTRSPTAFYFVSLAILAVAVLATIAFRDSRSGRLLIAARDNPKAVRAYGVGLARTRLAAFAFSGALAALAGALLTYKAGTVDQGAYLPEFSVTVLSVAVIGGLTSVSGAVAGGFYYTTVLYLLPVDGVPGATLLATGVGLLLLLLVAPGGLAQVGERLRDRLLAAVAVRHGIDLTTGSSTAAAAASVAHVAVEGAQLSALGLHVGYRGVPVLTDVNLDVPRGEVLALLGTNGAGKSTLLRAITGLAPVTGGSVVQDGGDTTGASTWSAVRRGIALIPGGKGCFPALTVDEHLALACWTVPAADRAAASADALELFPRLQQRRGTKAGDLSGGEQQMLAVAIGLLTKPSILLIDELSLGLAPTIVGELLAVVREVSRRGVTVVLVEQSVNLALQLAERAVFLERGRIVFEGRTAELLERPDVLRAVLLTSSDAATAEVREFDPATPPALRAHGLVKTYGGVTAVSDVSFEVRPREIVGLLGPNGSGKSTLLDLLSGAAAPDSGTVVLGSADVTGWTPERRALAGLGRSFQDARLFGELTVSQNVAVALERHLPVRDHLAAALGMPEVRETETDIAWTVSDLLATTGLGGWAESRAADLSTGTRRVLELTMALAHEPDVLLLDEPAAGVAQREVEQLGPLLRNVVDSTGCALVLVEHDVPLMRSVCDRLIAMVDGIVVASGPPAEVLAHPVVVSSYLGGDASASERSGTERPAGTRSPVRPRRGRSRAAP